MRHHTSLLVYITNFCRILRFLLQSSHNTSKPVGPGVAWHYLHKRSSLHIDLRVAIGTFIQISINHSSLSPKPLVMAQISFKALIQSLCFLSMIALGSTQAPQCPNNLAVYNPNLRTICVNGSKATRLFLVPFLHAVDYILILLHSVHHCACQQNHSPKRRRALQSRTLAHVRHITLSERVSRRNASRARPNFHRERHPHDAAADSDALTSWQHDGAVGRSSRGREDWILLQCKAIYWWV